MGAELEMLFVHCGGGWSNGQQLQETDFSSSAGDGLSQKERGPMSNSVQAGPGRGVEAAGALSLQPQPP